MSPRDPNVTAPKFLFDGGLETRTEDQDPRIIRPEGLNESLVNKIVMELRRYYRIRLFLRMRASEQSLAEIVAKHTDIGIDEFVCRYVEEGDSIFEDFSFSKDGDAEDIDYFKFHLNLFNNHVKRFGDIHDLHLDLDNEQNVIDLIIRDLDKHVDMDDFMDVNRAVNEVVCRRIVDLLQMPAVIESPPVTGSRYRSSDRVGRHDHAYCDGGLLMLLPRSGVSIFWEAVRFSGIQDLAFDSVEFEPIGPFHVVQVPDLSYCLSASTFDASERGEFLGNFHGFFKLPLTERDRLIRNMPDSNPDINFNAKIFALIGYNTDGRAVTFWMEL